MLDKEQQSLKQVLDYHKDINAGNPYPFKLNQPVSVDTGILGYEFESDYLKLTKQGELTMKQRYTWDGPTGTKDVPESIFPSALHDALYQLIRLNVLPARYRAYADRLLRLAAIAQNITTTKAWFAYFIVRIAGWWFTPNRLKTWINSWLPR